MAKAGRIAERPRPPTFDEVQSDILAAGNDDVVFCLGEESNDKSSSMGDKSVVMEESYLDLSPSGEGYMSDINKTNSEQELVYHNVLELLRLNQQLEQAPERLQKEYNQLEKLGSDVSRSIDVLKDSSFSLPNKS